MQGITKREAKAYFTFVNDCEHSMDGVGNAVGKFGAMCDIESVVDAESRITEIEDFLTSSKRVNFVFDKHKPIS